MLRRWIGELTAQAGASVELADAARSEDIEGAFHAALSQAARTRRVVLLVDALNQFESTERARAMTWLPTMWPENARLIATSTPGPWAQALARRRDVKTLDLPPLGADAATEIAGAIYRRYHRSMEPKVGDALLNKRRDDGEAAAGNPLWLSLAVEELNLVGADEFARAFGDTTTPDHRRLLHLMLDLVREMPPDVVGLYEWMLRRAERLYGQSLARAFVAAIAVSRFGWRESDLKSLMPALSRQPWDALAFARLRRSFRAHLVQRGASFQWDFTHGQMREAVARRMAHLFAATHRALADHLLALPVDDPLHQSETMVHLLDAGDRTRAANYYGRDLTPEEAAGATQVLAERILADDGADHPTSLDWISQLATQPDVDDEHRSTIAHRFLCDLDRLLEHRARLTTRRRTLHAANQCLTGTTARAPDRTGWYQDLSISHAKLGDIFKAEGKAVEAEAQFRSSLDIAARLEQRDPSHVDLQRNLAASHGSLGEILRAQGKVREADAASEQQHAIMERLAQGNPGDPDRQRDLAVSHSFLGEIRRTQGRSREAEAHFRASHDIRERLARAEPQRTDRQRELSVSHGELGKMLISLGRPRDAEAEYRSSRAIAERLVRSDPDNPVWLRLLSIAHEGLGDLLETQGRMAGAETEFLESHTITESLARADASNADWQRDLYVSYDRLARILKAQQKLSEAEAARRSSQAIAARLADADPARIDWQRDLALSHINLGDILLAGGRNREAEAEYRTAFGIFERLANVDPANAVFQHELLVCHQRIGVILRAERQLAEAQAEFRAGHAIAERLATADPDNVERQRDLAMASYMIAAMATTVEGQVAWLRAMRAPLLRLRDRGLDVAERDELIAYAEGELRKRGAQP
jgi:tetratricopeptide (TPR) repeat protein